MTTWAEDDACLRPRGRWTVWFAETAVASGKAAPGGPPNSSDLAIPTAWTRRAVFDLAVRPTEGLMGSLLHLLGLNLPVPDHATLGRRARTVRLPPQPRA